VHQGFRIQFFNVSVRHNNFFQNLVAFGDTIQLKPYGTRSGFQRPKTLFISTNLLKILLRHHQMEFYELARTFEAVHNTNVLSYLDILINRDLHYGSQVIQDFRNAYATNSIQVRRTYYPRTHFTMYRTQTSLFFDTYRPR